MKEKMPLNPVTPVPFPSNAIAAEASRDETRRCAMRSR